MQPLHAVVKHGRLTLDEPTDLPDGQVVVLLPFDELLSLSEELSDEGDVGYTFVPAPRAWRSAAPVDARALLDELRSM